jgi:hypothetical protein
VNVNRYPSLENILSYLTDNDLETTERTLQRDLKTLREMCFIDVKYSRANDGYWIDEDSKRDFDEWMRVFNLFNNARVINEILLKSNTKLDFIDFDRNKQELKAKTGFSYASLENLIFQCPALSLDPPENAASGFAQDPKKMVALKGSTAQKYTTKMNKESRKSTGKPTE